MKQFVNSKLSDVRHVLFNNFDPTTYLGLNRKKWQQQMMLLRLLSGKMKTVMMRMKQEKAVSPTLFERPRPLFQRIFGACFQTYVTSAPQRVSSKEHIYQILFSWIDRVFLKSLYFIRTRTLQLVPCSLKVKWTLTALRAVWAGLFFFGKSVKRLAEILSYMKILTEQVLKWVSYIREIQLSLAKKVNNL